MKPRFAWDRSGRTLRIRFPERAWRRGRAEAILAAHAFSGRAVVRLDRGPGAVVVSLTAAEPLPPGERREVEAGFARELDTQRARLELQEAALPIREHVASEAFRPLPPSDPLGPEEELTPEQQAELDRLVAEVEAELKAEAPSSKDPLGITRTWEERRERGSAG